MGADKIEDTDRQPILTASIVLYEQDPTELMAAIGSCLSNSSLTCLYLIDNSSTDKLKNIVDDPRIHYIFNNRNIGFGAAHNKALSHVLLKSDYHLILNPDISFDKNVLDQLTAFMESHPDVGNVMPKILYRDGSIQRLCKLLPTPIHLFGRRFFSHSTWMKRIDAEYELNTFKYDRVMDIPNLSGCFMFTRIAHLKEVGCFDERYFMYLEDVDLIRRINDISRTVVYPFVAVYHGYQKASYGKGKLMLTHILSAIKYFNKWGWFTDKRRKEMNRRTLKCIQQL